MSQENVDVIRAIYDAWLRGDHLPLAMYDPEITMIESTSIPGAATVHGIDAVRRYQESFRNYWAEIRFEPLEYIDTGETVVVVVRLIGRGKRSGAAVDRIWTYVWTVRDKLALRMEAYSDRSEALKAVGLEE